MSPSDVERFRALIERQLGLQFPDDKGAWLGEVLASRLAATRQTASTYLAPPRFEPGEAREVVRHLTVPETFFLRGIEQLRAFATLALDTSASVRPGTVRVLSAGCATGEEPYSIAMVAREHPAREVVITAIDVDTRVLDLARAGLYSTWSLRDTPAPVRDRWFTARGAKYELAAAVRAQVVFEERNLAADDPSFWRPDAFDVVFCRNVLMYFSDAAAKGVVERFARSLRPGGLLFLGHAENLRGVSDAFELHHEHDTFYYERKAARAAGRARDVAWFEEIHRASERIHELGGRLESMTTSAQPARSDLSQVHELVGSERYVEARLALDALPSDARCDPQVRLLRAVLLTHGGNLDEARLLCAELLASDETSAGAHYLMALCREAEGKLAEAETHDRLASQLDPAFAMPRLHLGRLVRRAGDRREARRVLEDALGLLEREDAARLLLFGGGFRREALLALCRGEITACEVTS